MTGGLPSAALAAPRNGAEGAACLPRLARVPAKKTVCMELTSRCEDSLSSLTFANHDVVQAISRARALIPPWLDSLSSKKPMAPAEYRGYGKPAVGCKCRLRAEEHGAEMMRPPDC